MTVNTVRASFHNLCPLVMISLTWSALCFLKCVQQIIQGILTYDILKCLVCNSLIMNNIAFDGSMKCGIGKVKNKRTAYLDY